MHLSGLVLAAAAADSGGGFDLSGLLPAGGALSAVVLLVGYMLRTIAADRTEYRARRDGYLADLEAAEARTETERARVAAAQLAIDEERRRRREAEDDAATALAELAARDVLVRWYATERRRLEAYLPAAPGGLLPDPPAGLAEAAAAEHPHRER